MSYKHNIPEKFINFLHTDTSSSTYLHNTAHIDIALNIFNTGFRFINYLENTTDPVSLEDLITIKYFFNTRKAYGRYTMVIQIPHYIIDYCNKLVENTEFHFYELISELIEVQNEDESLFTLPNQFVKGFYNISEDIILKNSRFSEEYDLNKIDKKFKELKQKKE